MTLEMARVGQQWLPLATAHPPSLKHIHSSSCLEAGLLGKIFLMESQQALQFPTEISVSSPLYNMSCSYLVNAWKRLSLWKKIYKPSSRRLRQANDKFKCTLGCITRPSWETCSRSSLGSVVSGKACQNLYQDIFHHHISGPIVSLCSSVRLEHKIIFIKRKKEQNFWRKLRK